MSDYMLKLIQLSVAIYAFQSPCFAGKEHDEEKQMSLQRIYDVCDYNAEAGKAESTHRIVILDDGFDTYHKELKGVFVDPYDPINRCVEVNQLFVENPINNRHGTAVAGIIHYLTTAKLIPVIYGRNYNSQYYHKDYDHQLIALDYALNKAQGDIINLSVTLSQEGYCAGPISANVKDLLIKSFSEEKIIVCAAGNSHHAMSEMPDSRDLKELATLSNDKFIVVGATTPNNKGQEELWIDGSQLKPGLADSAYLTSVTLGSTYPGDDAEYQKIFMTAPARHYAPEAYVGDKPITSSNRNYFGMTSSAAPVVVSFVERWWKNSPNSTAADIGHAAYNGTNQGFLGYKPAAYGEGQVNYRSTLELLQTSPYQNLRVIEE